MNVLCLILALALAISLLMVFRLHFYARKYYLRYNLTCLDPYGTRYYPPAAPDASRGRARPRIMFYGDSRSVGWSSPPVEGAEFVNRGVSGQTTAQVLMRFNLHAASMSPDLAIIQVGINDLKTIPLYPGRRDLTVKNCRDGIATLVGRFRDLGADVILTTIFPHSAVPLERKLFWSSRIGDAVEEVNAAIRGLESEGVRVLDAHAILNDRARIRREFAADTLHLSAGGYDALNEQLVPLIEEWMPQWRSSRHDARAAAPLVLA